jgi:PPOX class probable F420-dependent enzyme
MADKLTAEQRAFLQEKRFGVLATIDPDGVPQQSVIWFELQGDQEILMNTKRGRRKDRNLVRDGRASICFEDSYRYLTVSGPVTLEDDQQVAQADIERLATRYTGPETAQQRMRDQFSKEERITVRLRIEHVYSEGFDGA